MIGNERSEEERILHNMRLEYPKLIKVIEKWLKDVDYDVNKIIDIFYTKFPSGLLDNLEKYININETELITNSPPTQSIKSPLSIELKVVCEIYHQTYVADKWCTHAKDIVPIFGDKTLECIETLADYQLVIINYDPETNGRAYTIPYHALNTIRSLYENRWQYERNYYIYKKE